MAWVDIELTAADKAAVEKEVIRAMEIARYKAVIERRVARAMPKQGDPGVTPAQVAARTKRIDALTARIQGMQADILAIQAARGTDDGAPQP